MATRVRFLVEVREPLEAEPVMVKVYREGLVISIDDDLADDYIAAGKAVEEPEE